MHPEIIEEKYEDINHFCFDALQCNLDHSVLVARIYNLKLTFIIGHKLFYPALIKNVSCIEAYW
jgi:hypothetical protein